MNKRLLALPAAALIALGAMGDHVLSQSSSPSAAADTSHTNGTSATFATNRTSSTVNASSIDQATEQAYAIASPSVVYVVSTGVGTGSGVIYDDNGNIVTNNHVVSGANGLSVTLNNGKTYRATLVGTDSADDLAVIHINASGLTPAHFASAGDYSVAQTVLAIGSPLGLKQSVTSGLISALNRVEQEPNGAYLPSAIQTSAPINPGNSGGALVTLDGTVVGIPTLEQTSSTDGTSTQGIGFAIPSDRVTAMVDQIVANGKVTHTDRPYLGIAPSDSSSQSSGGFNFGFGQGTQTAPSVNGAYVSRIASGGPSAKAGVQQGDVITGIDGSTVTSAQDLLDALSMHKPGDSVTLNVNRNGSTQTVHVTLGELPASS